MNPHVPRFSCHLGYLFTELPFAARFTAAQEVGFSAVEHPAPYAVAASEMAKILARTGMSYAQFALKSGDPAKGEKGIGIFPERRAEFRASLAEGLDYAEAIGVTQVHAMAGKLPEADRRTEHFETYCENLHLAAAEGQERGIRILLEAFSPGAIPDYYLDSATRGAELIREVGHPNIGLLLDIYHAHCVGEDPEALIRENRDLIAHIHIADFPGRHEPGTGQIDFASLMRTLGDVRFDGLIGCEYVPAGGTRDGLEWLSDSWAQNRS